MKVILSGVIIALFSMVGIANAKESDSISDQLEKSGRLTIQKVGTPEEALKTSCTDLLC